MKKAAIFFVFIFGMNYITIQGQVKGDKDKEVNSGSNNSKANINLDNNENFILGIIEKVQEIIKNIKEKKSKEFGTNYTYVYDFSNPAPDKDSIYEATYTKDRIFVKIININRLAFDIIGDSKNLSITLSNINIFDSVAQKSNAVKDSISQIKHIEFINFPVDTGSSKKIINKDPISKNIDSLTILIGLIKSGYNSILIDNNKLSNFLNFSKSLPLIIQLERGNQVRLKKRILENYYLIKYEQKINSLDDLISICSNKPISLASKISENSKKIIAYNKSVDSISVSLTKLCKAQKGKKNEICNKLNTLKSNLPKDLNEITTSALKINPDSVLKVSTILCNLIALVNDPANFYYYSPAYSPEGDFLSIGIKIKPKDKKSSMFSDTISYKIPVNGRFEWAIGPALNFGFFPGSFDNSYSIDSARTKNGLSTRKDTFTIRANKSNKYIMPSLGVSASFYWQNHHAIIPGINIGLSSAPTDLSTLRAYLGASFIVGGFSSDSKQNLTYNKLIFNIGLSYGQVNRLKENLNIGDNPKSQIPYNGTAIATDQLVEKVGRVGFYFGFTYKLN